MTDRDQVLIVWRCRLRGHAWTARTIWTDAADDLQDIGVCSRCGAVHQASGESVGYAPRHLRRV